MSAGRYRHQIALLAPVRVADGAGGFTETWVPVVPSPVWAAEDSSASLFAERLLGQQLVAQTSVIFRTWYHRGLAALSTPEQLRCRVQRGDQLYAIKGLADPEGRHLEHVLACQEVRA